MLFPYAKSSISLIFVQKTQFSSLNKRLFIAYITKTLGGIFLVCKNLSFWTVKSKIGHFCKVPCEHTGLFSPWYYSSKVLRLILSVISLVFLKKVRSCISDSFSLRIFFKMNKTVMFLSVPGQTFISFNQFWLFLLSFCLYFSHKYW